MRKNRMTRSGVIATLTAALLLPGTVAHAAVANDPFASPTTVTGTRILRTSDSNVGATSEPAEPQHAGEPGGASIWYRWTPALSGPVAISTANSSFDTLLAVYIGTSVGSLAPVSSNDDDPSHPVLTSVVRFEAVAGTSYAIAVDGYAGDQGTVRLKLTQGPPSTSRVSVSDLEAQANNDSETAAYDGQNVASGTTALDVDGSVVAFTSSATNLVLPTSDTNGCTDVFIREPEAGTTQRVSISDQEAQGNNCSQDPGVSADGNVVAFTSDASNLIQPTTDGNGCSDIFLRNRALQTTQRVSLTNAGGQANDCSQNPAMSADGNVILFESWATNLVSPLPNGNLHLFARNVLSGTTVQVTKTTGGTQANNASNDPAVSADGRYVAFESRATNLGIVDTNGLRDIYLADLQTGTITRVSQATGGAEVNGNSFNPAISADGRYIVFESDATNFIASDTNGARDVFLHDAVTGITSRVSTRSNGTQGKGASRDPQISDAGRYVTFSSTAPNLVTNDANTVADIFLKDLQTGITTRVSVDVGGNEAGAASSFPTISGDGTQVGFTSEANDLVSDDTLGNSDVFRRPVGYQPDALIRRSSSSLFVGDGIYESSPVAQKLPVAAVRRGAATSFVLVVQNDGSVSDEYGIVGCGNSKGFVVTYTVGTSDVTSAVVAGMHKTGSLRSDEDVRLDVTIAVASTATVGKTKLCTVAATSISDPARLDTVSVSVKIK